MPRLENVKITGAEEVWKSPDGQRTIHEVTFDYEGHPMKAKTYSSAIAAIGWSGTLESYEMEGKGGRPSQTFVKQPPKEGGFTGSFNTSNTAARGTGTAPTGLKPFDNYTMYLSYVKDIAVALINSKAYTVERLNEIASDVANTGEAFYNQRPDAPKTDTAPEKTELDKAFDDFGSGPTDEPWNPGKL